MAIFCTQPDVLNARILTNPMLQVPRSKEAEGKPNSPASSILRKAEFQSQERSGGCELCQLQACDGARYSQTKTFKIRNIPTTVDMTEPHQSTAIRNFQNL